MLDVLYWLPAEQRISYRIVSMVWRCLLGLAPLYLRELYCPLHSAMSSRSLRSSQHIAQSALEFCPIHCPNGRLGQDLGFGGFAFALKLPELLNRNLAAVRAKLGQTSCFHNGPRIWCPIGQ